MEALSAYYDATWIDYRVLWLNRRNLSIHFGYTDATTTSHAHALEQMNAILAERAALRPGERVLDAGCGVGGSSFWLAERRGANVVGVTPVRSQVLRARRFAARRQLDGRVSFEQASFISTGLADGSFDVVWALESLCHASDKGAFYREAARLLRPGGRIIVAEYIRRKRSYDETNERLLHSWLDGWAIPDLDSCDEHMAHLATAGFTSCACDDVTVYVRPSLHRLHRLSYWSYPLALLLRAVGLRSAVQQGNVRGSRHQYQALRRGLWFYGIIAAVKP